MEPSYPSVTPYHLIKTITQWRHDFSKSSKSDDKSDHHHLRDWISNCVEKFADFFFSSRLAKFSGPGLALNEWYWCFLRGGFDVDTLSEEAWRTFMCTSNQSSNPVQLHSTHIKPFARWIRRRHISQGRFVRTHPLTHSRLKHVVPFEIWRR